MQNSSTQSDNLPPDSCPPSPPPSRPYRAKGPTLGKGKACELCRSRRVVRLRVAPLSSLLIAFRGRSAAMVLTQLVQIAWWPTRNAFMSTSPAPLPVL